ncbi:hypothetical protein ES703_09348 [subsurface metagenome]
MGKDFEDTLRCAGNKPWLTGQKTPQAVWMKTVNILKGRDAFQHCLRAYLGWQRQLHQNAMEALVIIEPVNELEEFGLGSRYRQVECFRGQFQTLKGPGFGLYVNGGGRVITHQYHRQSGNNILPAQVGNTWL